MKMKERKKKRQKKEKKRNYQTTHWVFQRFW
jgi:hypothetical protein